MKLNYLRIVWFGFLTLALSVLPSVFFLMTFPCASHSDFFIPSTQNFEATAVFPLSMKLNLSTDFSALSIGNARSQLFFSVDPPRPDAKLNGSRLMIRLAQGKQLKRVELPAKVELEFSENVLRFSDLPSRFWLVCSSISEREISATLFYETPEGEEVSSASWLALLQETPIQSAEEFPAISPFRLLGEARWWGPDVFLEKYSAKETMHRIEIGPPSKGEFFDCSFADWLVFKEGKWQKKTSFSEATDCPIAHLKNVSAQGLEIEAWDGAAHIRIKLALSSLPSLKMRGDELFTQLRVRSEKQVSCMLDKQCLILRPNDWALKTQGRWKILRKKEEKNAFLDRKLIGDLFVLDRIESKGTTKSVMGHYFSSGRSQMVPIEYVQKSSSQKGIEGKR